MFKTLWLLNESRPSVRIKRFAQMLASRMEGQKIRKKYQRMIDQLQKPEYKTLIETKKN